MTRRRRAAATAAACLLALPVAAHEGPPPAASSPDHAAALARFQEQAPRLFRVWPEEGASVYAVEPRVPRLPVRLVVAGADDMNLDRRCALASGVMQVALEGALAEAGLALAGEDEPDVIEVAITASTEAYQGETCLDLVAAQARLSRRVAEVGGAAYAFEPVIHADAVLVEHRPRDFPTRAFGELADRLAGAIVAALDEVEGEGVPVAPPSP